MTTLYDVLGALPNDDADELRAAFRKAVKSAHPDVRPGDPNAALKFRQILRANDILSDIEQRAAYDHLLVLARREQEREHRQDAGRAVAAKLHKFASVVMAVAGASIVTVGGYLLWMHMPANSIAQSISSGPPNLAAPLVVSVPPVTIAPLKPLSVAAAAIKTDSPPTKQIEIASEANPGRDGNQSQTEPATSPASATSPPADKQPQLLAKIEDRPSDPDRTPCALTGTGNDCGPEITGAVPSPVLNDARFYHDRGMLAYGKGELLAAAADLDHAIKLDPKFSGAYINRSVVLYRLRKFDRAFADIAKARRLEKANRAMMDAMASKPQPRQLKPEQPRVTRVSQRQSISD